MSQYFNWRDFVQSLLGEEGPWKQTLCSKEEVRGQAQTRALRGSQIKCPQVLLPGPQLPFTAAVGWTLPGSEGI